VDPAAAARVRAAGSGHNCTSLLKLNFSQFETTSLRARLLIQFVRTHTGRLCHELGPFTPIPAHLICPYPRLSSHVMCWALFAI
jgi:hypothetical protein